MKKTKTEDEIAAQVLVTQVMAHIDTMYPKVWDAMSASAKVSIRNTMRAQAKILIEQTRMNVSGEWLTALDAMVKEKFGGRTHNR